MTSSQPDTRSGIEAQIAETREELGATVEELLGMRAHPAFAAAGAAVVIMTLGAMVLWRRR